MRQWEKAVDNNLQKEGLATGLHKAEFLDWPTFAPISLRRAKEIPGLLHIH